MSKIDVDPEKLADCLQKLETLHSDIAITPALPEGADNSLTYDQLRKEYEELRAVQESMLRLIKNTIDALEYARKAMVMTDTATADAETKQRLQRMTEGRTGGSWKS